MLVARRPGHDGSINSEKAALLLKEPVHTHAEWREVPDIFTRLGTDLDPDLVLRCHLKYRSDVRDSTHVRLSAEQYNCDKVPSLKTKSKDKVILYGQE
jgi:hypothetical protein